MTFNSDQTQRYFTPTWSIWYGCSIRDGITIGPFIEIQRGAVLGAQCKISLHTFIRTVGEVVLLDDPNLSFPISGKIEGLLVEEGDAVQEGTVVAPLDTTALSTDIAQEMDALAVYERVLA